MLDALTLRVTFGLIAVCVLALFYGVTYRSTRSAFSGWWCLALACFIGSATLFVTAGTSVQGVAFPIGYAFGVAGGGFTWTAARSLRAAPPTWPPIVVAPAVVAVFSALHSPAHDVWAGAPVYFSAMSLMLALTAVDAGRAARGWSPPAGAPGLPGASAGAMMRTMAIMSGVMAVFFAVRALVLVTLGPDSLVFTVALGAQAATLITLLLLVVVTFGMSTLSHAQQASELQVRAARDDLTGVLTRAEFQRRALTRLDGAALLHYAVLVADLDRFKTLNDSRGHAAGDHALSVFGEVCRETVGPLGLVGRLGGDEFVVLVPDLGADEVARTMARRYSALLEPTTTSDAWTASIGIARVEIAAGPDADLVVALARADDALYRAKAAGRGRVQRWESPDGPRADETLVVPVL